jgi:hypothetical protein
VDRLLETDRVVPPGLADGIDDPKEAFVHELLAEACLAVARDMECYDYQIGRLIRKVSVAINENPSWAADEEHLLRLIRSAAAGFGGRREMVWIASFESGIDTSPPPPAPRRRSFSA